MKVLSEKLIVERLTFLIKQTTMLEIRLFLYGKANYF